MGSERQKREKQRFKTLGIKRPGRDRSEKRNEGLTGVFLIQNVFLAVLVSIKAG